MAQNYKVQITLFENATTYSDKYTRDIMLTEENLKALIADIEKFANYNDEIREAKKL